jgi:uncharacterized protein (TIGR03086 family)
MEKHLLLREAATVTLDMVDGIGDGDMAAATPCAGWDVRALAGHLLHWGPSLEGAARKEAVAPGEVVGSMREQLERLADAWGEAEAWQGVTQMGGPAPLPGDLVGGMVLGEFVLHGWDLARATGRTVDFPPGVLRLMYAEVARSAEQGRAMGVYGAEVPVAADASLMARTLALSGRDPRWTPPK